MGFFRYPGGKSKLSKPIIKKLNELAGNDKLEYREPFYGGGNIRIPERFKNIWLNDFDLGISAIWTATMRCPDLLKKYVLDFKPSVEAFDKFKEDLLLATSVLKNDSDIASYGFKKLAIHQISYSGLGTKSGGPLGGRDQKSSYKIDCRWSPKYICKKIDENHKRFSTKVVKYNGCTNLDFSPLIYYDKCDAILYLDPPYFVKGNELYQHGFSQEDHIRLARCLKYTSHRWVLSYDDCPEIRELYGWANIEEINDVSYTITATKDKNTGERKSRVKSELLIWKSK